MFNTDKNVDNAFVSVHQMPLWEYCSWAKYLMAENSVFFPIAYTMFKANIFPAPTDGSFLLCARYADYRKSHFLLPHYSRAVGVEEMSDWCIWAEWIVRVPFS